MNHSLDKYPTYKPSNIDWIGEIPSHWEVSRVKWITERHKQGYYTTEDYIDEGVKLIRITDLNSEGEISFSSCPSVVISPKDEDIFALKEFDFLFPRTGSIGSFGFVKNPERSVFASYLISFRFYNNIVSPNFLKYYFSSNMYLDGLFSNLHGGVNQNIHAENIKDQNIFLPPLSEQQAIVTYLDEKTTLIDELIAKKQSKIELLKEQRTALINHAVTKGLNAEVALKDSKDERIGEIPEHWGIRRLSTFGIFSKGKGIRKDQVKDVGFPCIRYGEIYTKYDRVVYNPISCIDEETAKESLLIEKGNVLFTGSGETVGDIGKSIVYYGEEKIFVGGDIIVLKLFKGLNSLFISYLMNADFIQFQKSLSGKGEIVVHIYSKNIREIITPLPPLSEQQAIVAYLDEQTALIDKNIELESQKIEKLKEYRQSLISNVVTGKIKVID